MRLLMFIGTVDFLLTLIGYIYWRHNLTIARSWQFGCLYLLLALNTVVSPFLPPSTPLMLTRASAWLEGLWIAFGYYSVLLAVLHLLLWLVTRALGLALPSSKIATLGLAFICCFIAWGSYRAFHPTIRTEQIVTDKLPSGSSYKIAFLTDLHMGRILGHDYAAKLAARVNEQQPDFVLLAGDVIDERIFYVEQQDSLTALTQIKAPIYMSFGNHEYLDDPDRWEAMLKDKGIHVLRDADTIVASKIKITGLEDYMKEKGTAAIFDLAQDNKKYYDIILDHQPRRFDAAAEAGYDLYLAGHTHTGQLFPNRMVTKRMYKLDYGRTNFAKMTAITSNGYGFWGPPVRTEVAPEMIIIELKGK